jgi:hypothetical protein
MTDGAERFRPRRTSSPSRICFTPAIALPPFIEGYRPAHLLRPLRFVLTDVLDGYLSSRQQVTDPAAARPDRR